MMPVVKNEEQFEHWVKAYPFYENIQKEGSIVQIARSIDKSIESIFRKREFVFQ